MVRDANKSLPDEGRCTLLGRQAQRPDDANRAHHSILDHVVLDHMVRRSLVSAHPIVSSGTTHRRRRPLHRRRWDGRGVEVARPECDPGCGHRTPNPRLPARRSLRAARLLPAESSHGGERDRVAPSVRKRQRRGLAKVVVGVLLVRESSRERDPDA